MMQTTKKKHKNSERALVIVKIHLAARSTGTLREPGNGRQETDKAGTEGRKRISGNRKEGNR